MWVGPGETLPEIFSGPPSRVRATYMNGQTREVLVTPRKATFPGRLSVWPGFPRRWPCPNIDPDIRIDAGESLFVTDDTPALGSRVLRVSAPRAGSYPILARLDRQGPILASAAVQAATILPSTEVNITIGDRLADGTMVVEASVMLSGDLGDSEVIIKAAGGGVVSPDGTTTVRLRASDFDEFGIARFTLLVPPYNTTATFCHTIELFNHGEQIGAYQQHWTYRE